MITRHQKENKMTAPLGVNASSCEAKVLPNIYASICTTTFAFCCQMLVCCDHGAVKIHALRARKNKDEPTEHRLHTCARYRHTSLVYRTQIFKGLWHTPRCIVFNGKVFFHRLQNANRLIHVGFLRDSACTLNRNVQVGAPEIVH